LAILLFSPNLIPTDFFLFPKIKNKLAGNSITEDSYKRAWEGVVRTQRKDDFTKDFQKW
jgi:hypothetical protein